MVSQTAHGSEAGVNTRPSRQKPLRRSLAIATLLLTGCSQLIDPNVPEPLRPMVEPEFDRPYLLYRPSNYDRRYDWPLVVVCHSSIPDSPNRRIRAWTRFAESYGFLVAAPKLHGVRRFRRPKAAKQLTLQRDDERAILSVIRHVRAGYNVSRDRIFLHGFSGGAHAALYTGLKHPDLFRALAVTQPKFDEGLLGDVVQTISPHQPIELVYDITDAITGKNGSRCLSWLRGHGAQVRANPAGGLNVTDMRRPVAFFENVVRTRPWIHIRVLPGPSTDPLEVQFKLQSSVETDHVEWAFGDETTTTGPTPVHRYARPGTYRVAVTIRDDAGQQHRRGVDLSLPEGSITPVRTAPEKE